jgi:hypothetical protein
MDFHSVRRIIIIIIENILQVLEYYWDDNDALCCIWCDFYVSSVLSDDTIPTHCVICGNELSDLEHDECYLMGHNDGCAKIFYDNLEKDIKNIFKRYVKKFPEREIYNICSIVFQILTLHISYMQGISNNQRLFSIENSDSNK